MVITEIVIPNLLIINSNLVISATVIKMAIVELIVLNILATVGFVRYEDLGSWDFPTSRGLSRPESSQFNLLF